MLNSVYQRTFKYLFYVDKKRFLLTILFLFLALGISGLSNHEMWRDELQAWLIARDSGSPLELIQNLRYEGHPGLWHTLLYIITRFTENPAYMQLAHLMIGAINIALIVWFSPFSRFQKFFLSFSFFLFYEYLIVSRNYSIAILLIFLICSLYHLRAQKPLMIMVVLGLLANTNFYGWMISISFAIVFSLEFIQKQVTEPRALKLAVKNRTTAILGVVFYIASAAASFLLVMPPEDRWRGTDSTTDFSLSHLVHSATALAKAYIPVLEHKVQFWDTNLLLNWTLSSLDYPYKLIVPLMLSACIIAFSAWLIKTSRNAFLIYLIGTGLMFSFTYVKYHGAARHHGNFFILLVACVWIALYEAGFSESASGITPKDRRSSQKVFSIVFTLFLSIHFLAGIWPYYTDLRYPFSMQQAAADYLSQYQGSSDFRIAGYRSSYISPLAATLGEDIYYPQAEKYGSFIVWKKDSVELMEHSDVVEDLIQKAHRFETNWILVLNEPMSSPLIELFNSSGEVSIAELKRFAGSIVQEDFYIYKVAVAQDSSWT